MMVSFTRWSVPSVVVAACLLANIDPNAHGQSWQWSTSSPESQGLESTSLESAWVKLKDRGTTALLVIRNDTVIFERYADGYSRSKPHYTASMAKAIVGGIGLMLAMDDRLIDPDDLAGRYVSQWRDDSGKKAITVRHLATHTSGIEDAEDGEVPHEQLTGWKGDFWKRLEPPRDPFTLARDQAPVMEAPGSKHRYSNPGMAMLGYCISASLPGTPKPDLRSFLKHRVMDPLGVPDSQWSVGYNTTYQVDGLPLVAPWGGGAYSPDAVARVGRLLLHQGQWNGKLLITPQVVAKATRHAGMPGYTGLAWWVNHAPDGSRLWPSAPLDAFAAAGAGHQFLLVVPSLNLIVVRNGQTLDASLLFEKALDKHLIAPVLQAVSEPSRPRAPYPSSPVIKDVQWAPRETILRAAKGGDNWPVTWADDDAIYTAYGDGRGFEPFLPEKLSLGFARILGSPESFTGINIRSPSGEQLGDGPKGLKASGLLMLNGTLYLWARNTGNSRLAWSTDHAQTWTWCTWKFTNSLGCPTFLNFGQNYTGARDKHVYFYSQDRDSAYEPADQVVLGRVLSDRLTDRESYEFFGGVDSTGDGLWTTDLTRRQPVFSQEGACYRLGASYNSGLKRYLLCVVLPSIDPRFQGGFGIYDAPEPWGPWTTAYFTASWDVGPGETCSLPTKWMSADGKVVHLVFSGDDCFSVRQAILKVE